MTPEQKAALEWLDAMYSSEPGWRNAIGPIKAMLAEPRLPKEPSEEILLAMDRSASGYAQYARNISMDMYRALYAHLTAPTKTAQVYHVEYSFREFEALDWKPQISVYPDTPEGHRDRNNWIASFKGDKRVSCIHVTGPHKQEVPV